MLYLQMMTNAPRIHIRAQISRCALIRLVHLSVCARKDTRRQEIPAQVRCYNNDKNQGIKLIRNRKTMLESLMDEDARKLRMIGSIKEICFRRRRNETLLPSDLTLA